jgi:hypothetical protein
MCLACEMDTLWFAEMEAQAARVAAPLPAGDAPVPAEERLTSGGYDPIPPRREEVKTGFFCEEIRSE